VALRAGAASALCVQLGNALSSTTFHSGIVVDTLEVISIVYQCSNDAREASFKEIGSELLPLLMRALRKCSRKSPPPDIHRSIKCGSRILLLLSVLETAKVKMEHHNSILPFSEAVLQSPQCPNAVKLEIVATLKNLSSYAEDYRAKMVRNESLINSLTIFCNDSNSGVIREGVASVLRNLAMGSHVKEALAQNPRVLNTIMTLLSDPNVRIRRDAVNATLSLALVAENKSLLATHYDGAFLCLLAKLLTSDVDVVVRRRAARTLRCLSHEDTADIILHQSSILKMVTKAAISDVIEEVRLESARAITDWAMEQPVDLSFNPALLTALIHILESSAPACTELASTCLAFQTSLRSNHGIILNNAPVVNIMSEILSQPEFTPRARENVFEILVNISQSPDLSKQLMSMDFLDSVVAALSAQDENAFTTKSRNYAADIVCSLSSTPTNRASLVRQHGLMVALIQFSTTTPDVTRKTGMKKLMMHLVPEL
jgi:hypothetical protein